jgi:hypothetical protein
MLGALLSSAISNAEFLKQVLTGKSTETERLGHYLARKDFTRCSQHEKFPWPRWISSIQIQVAEHAALCWDKPHKAGPAASDAPGGTLNGLNPPLMLWSVWDCAAEPQRRHEPLTRATSEQRRRSDPQGR